LLDRDGQRRVRRDDGLRNEPGFKQPARNGEVIQIFEPEACRQVGFDRNLLIGIGPR
jgi:hypothetical protein